MSKELSVLSVAASGFTANWLSLPLKLALFVPVLESEWTSLTVHCMSFGLTRSTIELLLLCASLLQETRTNSTSQVLKFLFILLIFGLFTDKFLDLLPIFLTLGLSYFLSEESIKITQTQESNQNIEQDLSDLNSKLESFKSDSTPKKTHLRRSSTLLKKLRSMKNSCSGRSATEESEEDSQASGVSSVISSRKSSIQSEDFRSALRSQNSVLESIIPGMSNEEIKEIINTLISQEYLLWNPEKCGESDVDVIAIALEAKNMFTQSIENLPGSSHRTIKVQRRPVLRTIRSMMEVSEPLAEMLESIGEWDFNCFELIKITKDPAFEVGLYIFNTLGLCDRFSIENMTLRKFLSVVESSYNRNNFYHNSLHAADVTASTLFLIQKGLSRCGNLVDIDAFSLVFAALCHDISHPGVNNAFLVATSHELALKYNDQSCLENMHANKAFTILNSEGCKITSKMNKADFQRFRKSAVGAILSTDLQVHFHKLSEFRANVDKKMDLSDDKFRALAIQMCLKCADIGHGARKLEIHIDWTCLITKEFFNQGEKEKTFGIPLTPLCDRENCVVSKSQIGFLEVLVRPLFKVWEDFVEQNNDEAEDLDIKICLSNINENIEYWNEDYKRFQEGLSSFELDNSGPPLASTP